MRKLWSSFYRLWRISERMQHQRYNCNTKTEEMFDGLVPLDWIILVNNNGDELEAPFIARAHRLRRKNQTIKTNRFLRLLLI